MNEYGLDKFLKDTKNAISKSSEPADNVELVAPLMHHLLKGDRDFLKPAHFRSAPDHYARNAVYLDEDSRISLYTLVWLPGQWTPVHDHGTWGVVGVVQGVLEERNFIRMDTNRQADTGIELYRGGPILLSEGTVTTFVPNPDHIHKTGVPHDRGKTVSLHLYGREMNSFFVYEVENRSRKLIEVFHNES